MLFKYKVVDQNNQETEGSIDAIGIDTAISSLQKRGLVVVNIVPAEEDENLLSKNIAFFDRITNKDVVILSRQVATLFTSQVSALRIFRLLSSETENKALGRKLEEIATDIQGGSTISKALSKHPKVFSPFYVNMVRAGEESGKLDETFVYLADYLDRNYEVTSKAKNALIYPAFVILTFITVMAVMLTVVIPKVSAIIVESGQEIPIYTRIVIGISNVLTDYGFFVLIAVFVGIFLLWKSSKGERGGRLIAELKLGVPYVGNLYRKLYLSRIADNMNTMLASGIPMIKVIELTAAVVDNKIYEDVLNQSLEMVKGGSPVSEAFGKFPEIPSIMVQMAKIGEETGELGNILKTLANFYQREVVNAVDTLVDLIEPVMIVLLGLGVAFLLASVLIPIYNISASI